MSRFVILRRYQVLGLLLVWSALYWLAAWVWVEADAAAATEGGQAAVAAAVHAWTLAWYASSIGVVATVALHAVGAALAGWRGDREALIGLVWSAVLHLTLGMTTGVVGPA